MDRVVSKILSVIEVCHGGRTVASFSGSLMKDELVEPHDRYYGPDHHIWNNNGTWWCHLSLARQRGPAKRICFQRPTLIGFDPFQKAHELQPRQIYCSDQPSIWKSYHWGSPTSQLHGTNAFDFTPPVHGRRRLTTGEAAALPVDRPR